MYKLFLKNSKKLFFKLTFKYNFLSKIYFFLTKSFDEEQLFHLQAYGKYRYYNDKESIFHEFCVKIHSIEKGFSMPERKPIWGKKNLPLILKNMEYLLTNYNSRMKSTLEWGINVMNNYFKYVNYDNEIHKFKDEFEKIKQKYKAILKDFYYVEDIKVFRNYKNIISSADFLSFINERVSIRQFKNKKVSENIIDYAVTVALKSPSACNRQGYEIYISNNIEKTQEISRIASGSRGLVDNIPNIAVFVGKRVAYPRFQDRHVMYVDSSLAAMSFIYGMTVQGIATLPLVWQDYANRNRELKKVIGLKDIDQPILLIAFGYPKEDIYVPTSKKQNIDKIRHFI